MSESGGIYESKVIIVGDGAVGKAHKHAPPSTKNTPP